jgi:hypothetical protein
MHVNEHSEEELNSVGFRTLAKLFTGVSHRKLPTDFATAGVVSARPPEVNMWCRYETVRGARNQGVDQQ